MKKYKQYFIAILSGMFLSVTGVQAVYNDTGTDYSDATTESWIDMGEAMQPLDFAGFLMCIAKNTGAHLVINGTYNALIDTAKCQTGQSSSKPEIANVSVITSRADNSSPQIVQAWLEVGSDAGSHYMVEASISEGVSADAPYGTFTFKWKNESGTDKGNMAFTAGTTSSTVTMQSQEFRGSSVFSWLNGVVNNDKVSGAVRTGVGANTYAVSFNDNFVNSQKTGDAEACTSRTSYEEFVHDYNIYDEDTGAKIMLSGPFQCTYESANNANATMQCFVGPSFAWYEGADTNVTAVTRTSDSQAFTGITYDPNDDGTAGSADDGIYVVIPGATFDDPITFAKGVQATTPVDVQAIMGASDFLEYVGGGQLFGLPWQCTADGTTWVVDDYAGSCDSAISYRPAAKIDDGTQLVGVSTNYRVKAAYSEKVMNDATGSCGTLLLSEVDAGTYPSFDVSDVVDLSIDWTDKPTIADAPSVIDGIVQ